MSACGHYPSRHSLHTPNFRGAIEALTECIYTISGVGTNSFTIDPSGYSWNFEGLVQVIEDLNWTLSGITAGAGSVVAGSGIYTTTSGAYTLVNSALVGGSGVYITYSGSYAQINTSVTQASGIIYTAGSGLYLSDGNTRLNLGAYGQGSTSVIYNGNQVAISGSIAPTTVTVSGTPEPGYIDGSLWFDTNQGRMFVYASGNGVTQPDWYETNGESFAIKSYAPPSGAGLNAPPRDGTLWFNNLVGSLFIYDATTSGWYQTGSAQTVYYGEATPPPQQQHPLWYDTNVTQLKIWNGVSWVSA